MSDLSHAHLTLPLSLTSTDSYTVCNTQLPAPRKPSLKWVTFHLDIPTSDPCDLDCHLTSGFLLMKVDLASYQVIGSRQDEPATEIYILYCEALLGVYKLSTKKS